jgi:biotin synthase
MAGHYGLEQGSMSPVWLFALLLGIEYNAPSWEPGFVLLAYVSFLMALGAVDDSRRKSVGEVKTLALSRIQVSIGTAAVLGLADVPMAVAPTTAYLMLGGRCLMNCAFCAQARESRSGALHLSRVTWPEYDLEGVVERLAAAAARGDVRRACLQVTVTADAYDRSLAILRTVKAAVDLPFDIAILPHTLAQVRELLDAGAEHIGFGLDAACERVFSEVKGGDWQRSLQLIRKTAGAFSGRAAVHLIVGLGETEQEMVGRVQWAHDLGLTVGLFAFTPLHGTPLADQPPPPLAVYRRMQAARWLVVHNLVRADAMDFSPGGELRCLGAILPPGGDAFRTSGCPDCNRPFYNEQPSGPMYNYPRPLSLQEARRAIQEMEIENPC